jgi:Ala-tRNA(Pro) deacylase
MKMLDRLTAWLDEQHVLYRHTTHTLAYTAREVARAEHMPERKLAKTLVFVADDRYGMAVLPADSLVDMQELRIVLDMPRLRLATERELSELFPECELGAMPPAGNLFGMDVYIDYSLSHEDEIAFNAGTHRDVIHMKFRDFARLVQPHNVAFARRAFA